MKQIYLVFLTLVTIGIIAISIAFGQAKPNNSAEAEIIALEKRGFEAWKNKDKKFFQDTLLDESLALYSSGVATKEQWTQVNINSNCTVQSYDFGQYQSNDAE
jgi:hypothetical protein